MKYAHAVFTLAIALAVSTPALAVSGSSGKLSGRVIDAVTHAPIAGAEIQVISPSSAMRTARTDSQGRFTFIDMQVDRYTLEFTDDGYRSQMATGIPVVPNDDSYVTVDVCGSQAGDCVADAHLVRAESVNAVF